MGKLEDLYSKYGIQITTNPYNHQVDALMASGGRKFFAQLGEAGTGKTWVLINEAAILFQQKGIDRALVLAPKGVDSNWLKDELPKHMPGGIKWTAALWRAGATVDQKKALGRISDRPIDFSFEDKNKDLGFRWLLMNWDAISTERGFSFACEFLDGHDAIVICDEAQKVKSYTSRRSKALMKIKPLAEFRRIATGTPVSNSPFDMFTPFSFLSEDILGTSSFFSFKNEHAQMIGPSNGLYWGMMKKIIAGLQAKGYSEEAAKEMAKRRMPQIVDKDEFERPIYRNLESLQSKIMKASFRVLKKDCLDLPEKIYKKVYFDLTPEQMKVYVEARDKLRLWIDQETILPLLALTSINKLSQITSGFFIETSEGLTHRIAGENPKLDLLKDVLEDLEGKTIIWGNLRAEISDIRSACVGHKVVEYHGGVSDKDRLIAIERFQHGDATIFIGHPKSGGTGLTLHAASNVVYYSNSYSMDTRSQSEDRAHRIGQKKNVLFIDLVALGTIEEKIIQALQEKSDLAATILGDW